MKRVVLARPVRSGPVYVKSKKIQETSGATPSPLPPPPMGRGGEGGSPRSVATKKESSMTEQTLDELVATLTPALRKQLLAKLALAAQVSAADGSPRDQDMWTQAVYEALEQAIGAKGGGLPGPMVVKRLLASTGAWASVSRFMEVSRMDQLKVTERQSVYLMLAKLVVDHARYVSREQDIPMSVRLIGNCATNVAAIFEQSFPGYLASGLTLMLARRLTAH